MAYIPLYLNTLELKKKNLTSMYRQTLLGSEPQKIKEINKLKRNILKL